MRFFYISQSCIHILSKVFWSTPKQLTQDVSWIRLGQEFKQVIRTSGISNRHLGTLEIVLKEVLWSMRDLIQQYEVSLPIVEVSLPRTLNDILILDQLQWHPHQLVFPSISWPWYRTWPSPNYEWFPWSVCNGCGMPAGHAYPSGHLVPSHILELVYAPIVETSFPELAVSFLDFSPSIPLGTSSIFFCFFTILIQKYYILHLFRLAS